MCPEFLLFNKLIYEPCGLVCDSSLTRKSECSKYGAYNLSLNNIQIEFRVARITPAKNGHFVTFWKRSEEGSIMPYDRKDPVDLFVVCVCEEDKLGQFVFPKSIFASKGIISFEGKDGKRAIRVYAPWIATKSLQAVKTQNWQIKYFIDLSDQNNKIDLDYVRKLYTYK